MAGTRVEIARYMVWYNEHRPHTVLGGATAGEVLRGERPAIRGAAGIATCQSDGASFGPCQCRDAGLDAADNLDGLAEADGQLVGDADADAEPEAEASACTGDLTVCFGSQCVDLGSDPENCGECGRTCVTDTESCTNGLCSSTMVTVPSVGTGSYKVDRTEVTRAQYAAWLATNPSPDSQPSDCAWNTTFEPDSACMSAPEVCVGDCDRHPQVCVDWCDAHAYCHAVGKRLCGAIAGGPAAFAATNDFESDQWYRACSDGAGSSYPYSDLYVPTYCNGLDLGLGTTVAVASKPECVTWAPDFAGIYDMSGNVDEWEDSCTTTSLGDVCRTRGGAYGAPDFAMTCDSQNDDIAPDQAVPFVGLRCCS